MALNKLAIGLAVGGLLGLATGPALGQAPVRRPVPPVGPESGAPHELPSNQESAVDIDRFIGQPNGTFMGVFEGLLTRSMLRAGDPYAAGPAGAVLEFRDDLSLASLPAHGQSRLIQAEGVSFYYVVGGSGRLDAGAGSPAHDLHAGVGVLAAPKAKHRFLNTGDAPLDMIRLTWKDNEGLTVAQDLKVVDTDQVPYGARRAHWVHASKPMFGVADGVNITLSAIMIPPLSYAGPHAHIKGVEEIWVKAGPGVGYALLGSEIRKFEGVGAFLSPPNGLTTHSSMNLDETSPQTWLYLSRRLPTADR
jgi:mannose-6-phosphate isomerase-like protein (cupin superfamily)